MTIRKRQTYTLCDVWCRHGKHQCLMLWKVDYSSRTNKFKKVPVGTCRNTGPLYHRFLGSALQRHHAGHVGPQKEDLQRAGSGKPWKTLWTTWVVAGATKIARFLRMDFSRLLVRWTFWESHLPLVCEEDPCKVSAAFSRHSRVTRQVYYGSYGVN